MNTKWTYEVSIRSGHTKWTYEVDIRSGHTKWTYEVTMIDIIRYHGRINNMNYYAFFYKNI